MTLTIRNILVKPDIVTCLTDILHFQNKMFGDSHIPKQKYFLIGVTVAGGGMVSILVL